MEGSDWKPAAGLLALMGLPRVGPATALAVARAEHDAVELPQSGQLGALHDEALEQIDRLQQRGVAVLGFFDDRFPARLHAMPSPPAVVYVRGDLAAFEGPALAVVGTRNPNGFGQTATHQLTLAAARRGVAIVSGLALGIDAMAHEAALEAGAPTIAVLGSGVDTVTPQRNTGLADRILGSGGALLSEQQPGTVPSPRTLVARNRLQAALADGLLVGQTGIKGGTMHTVRFAAEQGRRVWCPVPHSPSDESAGLTALLETPASGLPSALPAWHGHERLASTLGPAPLARPVTAATLEAWLDELLTPAATPPGQEQLSLDTGQ